MVKVLHFNYDHMHEGFYMHNLYVLLEKHPEIQFDSLPSHRYWDLIENKKLETMLDSYDILLIHASILSQDYVMLELPVKFPNLKIGVVTRVPDDYYESRGNVSIVNVRAEKILDYILSNSKESGSN